jgi:hypothetical protein
MLTFISLVKQLFGAIDLVKVWELLQVLLKHLFTFLFHKLFFLSVSQLLRVFGQLNLNQLVKPLIISEFRLSPFLVTERTLVIIGCQLVFKAVVARRMATTCREHRNGQQVQGSLTRHQFAHEFCLHHACI